jgi:integrase
VPRRKTLTDKQVDDLPRKEKRYTIPDPGQPGHFLRIPARGSRAAIAYAAVARDQSGKQIWETVGTADVIGIDEARDLVRQAIRAIKSGTPNSAPKVTVGHVCAQWVERVVRKKGYRTAKQIEARVGLYVLPEFGDRPISDIRKSDITAWLDKLEDERGAHAAEAGLKILRAVMLWHESRDDNFNSPSMRGMSRIESGGRDRVLTHAEIKKVWSVPGRYGDIVRLLLLTAQRRDTVVGMRWKDLTGNLWLIPRAERAKGNGGALSLPPIAMAIIERQPHVNDYVFYGQKGGPLTRMSAGQEKRIFDTQSGTAGWRLHDLRRTARSLMSRAGIPSEHAERVLGHTIKGVEGVYNRHAYDAEKAAALEKLAAVIEQIVGA